jgi:hypothetical protein
VDYGGYAAFDSELPDKMIVATPDLLIVAVHAAVFTTGPYMEMAISAMMPLIEHGVATRRVPLGNGAVPHVALEDCGYYARWLFDNPERERHES